MLSNGRVYVFVMWQRVQDLGRQELTSNSEKKSPNYNGKILFIIFYYILMYKFLILKGGPFDLGIKILQNY